MHERETLPGVIREVQAVVNLPLEINSSCPDALEAGMRVYNGKPLVRWPVREPASLESLLPLVKSMGLAWWYQPWMKMGYLSMPENGSKT